MSSPVADRPCCVLVVEDDAILRLHAIDIVEEAGFTAIEASNADDAIAILESRSDIALLLTDVDMPGSMDGLKLAHAVRDRWPPIKIVVVSGHVKLDRDALPPESRFFGKPFEAAKMVAELQHMVTK
jgi:DNA-binding NtrC family response regulator